MNSPLKRSALVAFGAVLAAVASCSDGPQRSATPHGPIPALAPAAAPSQADAVVCGTAPAGGLLPEGAPLWFVPSAIALKFQAYPEFAAFAGMQSVSTCAEAEVYTNKYAAYSKLHPGFDLNQPLVLGDDPAPPPEPVGLQATVTVSKILTGTAINLDPVVVLVNRPALGVTLFCSGTFIAKNWIVTAAHCLNSTNGKTLGWYVYDIGWTQTAAGAAVGSIVKKLTYYILQYRDGRYTGTFGLNSSVTPFDVALLYVPSTQDINLPPNPDKGSAMRIALTSLPSSVAYAAGWGGGDDPTFHTLEQADLVSYTLHEGNGTQSSVSYIQATLPTMDHGSTAGPFTGPWLCKGDSGGPIVDTFPANVPRSSDPSATVQNVPVALAAWSGCLNPANPTPSDPSGNFDAKGCCSIQGSIVSWSRLDNELPFIEQKMRKLYGPDFSCDQDFVVPSSGPLQPYAQCWRTPCLMDSDCADGEWCFNAGPLLQASKLTNCSVCGSPDMSCNCVYGQCLPN